MPGLKEELEYGGDAGGRPAAWRLRKVYSALLYLLVPLMVFRLLWLGRRNSGYLKRWKERFGLPPAVPADRPVLWLHSVSVGEVHAAGPLVRRFMSQYPSYRVIVTTTTPTGAVTVERIFGDQVGHLYFPYDLRPVVREYFQRVHPALMVIMETELWPNVLAECASLGIPVALVNARMSKHAADGYARVKTLAREVVRNLTVIAAQTDTDAQRYRDMGADVDRVVTCGNLKFDVHIPYSVVERGRALRQFLSVNRPIWIAASTHEGEESHILAAYAKVRAECPGCLLILAPRHPERCRAVEELSRAAGLDTVLRSREAEYDSATNVLILDTLGELASFYACSDVAFVGGSLVPVGGHNLLEPACLGVPVLSGPHVSSCEEVFLLLCNAGAAEMVENPDQLAASVLRLLADGNLRHHMGERGRQVFEENRGAVERVMDVLGPLVRT